MLIGKADLKTKSKFAHTECTDRSTGLYHMEGNIDRMPSSWMLQTGTHTVSSSPRWEERPVRRELGKRCIRRPLRPASGSSREPPEGE